MIIFQIPHFLRPLDRFPISLRSVSCNTKLLLRVCYSSGLPFGGNRCCFL